MTSSPCHLSSGRCTGAANPIYEHIPQRDGISIQKNISHRLRFDRDKILNLINLISEMLNKLAISRFMATGHEFQTVNTPQYIL